MLRGDELIMLSVECKLELELSYIWKIITLSPAQPLEVSDISSCLRNEAQRAAQLAIGQLSFWDWDEDHECMMWDVTHVQHTEKSSSVLTGQTILNTALCTVFGYSVVDVDYSPAEEN